MSKIQIASISAIIAIVMTQIGCSHSTQVTNNTAKPTGAWVGSTQDAQFPLVIGDSTGGTLTAVLDTNARTVIGAIYSRNDTDEVIFIGDSALPTHLIVGTKEIIFANYTDTSVDVVATDTAGSVGMQSNVNIRDLFRVITNRTNRISRTRLKSEVTSGYTIEEFIDEARIISDAKDFNDCILPILSNLSVLAVPFVGPNPAILLSGWFHPPDFVACQSLYDKIMEALQNSGAFKSPPPAPPSLPKLEPQDPWERGNEIDRYVHNTSGMAYWSLSGNNNQDPCFLSGEHPTVLGSHFAQGMLPGSLFATDSSSYISIDGAGNTSIRDAWCQFFTSSHGAAQISADGLTFGRFSFTDNGWSLSGVYRY